MSPQHPDVMSGKKTVEEVLLEFIETFEGDDGESGRDCVNRCRKATYATTSGLLFLMCCKTASTGDESVQRRESEQSRLE